VNAIQAPSGKGSDGHKLAISGKLRLGGRNMKFLIAPLGMFQGAIVKLKLFV